MSKKVKILTGILGLFMLMPGIAKFTQPFKSFIYQHLFLINFPFPNITQYIVKFSEVLIGLTLLILVFKKDFLNSNFRKKLFYLNHIAIISMMLVAIYVHLHPNVPAKVLPMEIKPPYMPVFYILLVTINLILSRKKTI